MRENNGKGYGDESAGQIEEDKVVGIEGHGRRFRKPKINAQKCTARLTPNNANTGWYSSKEKGECHRGQEDLCDVGGDVG